MGFEILSLLGRGFLDLVCPPKCVLCGSFPTRGKEMHNGLCPDCLEGFIPLPPAYCSRCGSPFEARYESQHTCGKCLKKSPVYDRALAAGIYSDNLRRAVHAFKYEGRTELAGPLASFMAANLSPPFYPPKADFIIPVPLHRKRLRERGFNQALLLARALFHDRTELIDCRILERSRWTEPQVNLKGTARRRNVRQAFTLNDAGKVKGKNVIIIDDVYTTGATVAECSRVFKRAGAAGVYVLTLARVGDPI